MAAAVSPAIVSW